MGKCDKLKWNRRKLGLSQEALAKKIGVSQATICRLERDETAWSFMRDDTSDAVCDILNKLGSFQCNLDNLFDGITPEERKKLREKYKEKRLTLGVTQKELSELLQIAAPTLSKFENYDECWEKAAQATLKKLTDFINGVYDSHFNFEEKDEVIEQQYAVKEEEPIVTLVAESKPIENDGTNPERVLSGLIDILNKKIAESDESKVYANMIIGLCNGYLKEA